MDFYQQGSLALIRRRARTPAIPPPGVALENDAANPGSAQFVITGNEGNDNSLEITGAGFTNQTSASPLTFADGTNAAGFTSDPSGESVNTTFTAYDSLGNPVNVDVTATMESQSTTGNTWRFFATSTDSKVGGPVLGDGTLTFNAQGQLSGSTGTTVNIDRTGTGAQSPMSVKLDFSGVTELAGSSSSLVMSSQDGMPPGTLNSYSFGADGIITGVLFQWDDAHARTSGRRELCQSAGFDQRRRECYTPLAAPTAGRQCYRRRKAWAPARCVLDRWS